MQNNPKSAENIASASNGQKTTQERQANFLSLTNLENQIPKPLFNQMVNHMNEQNDLVLRQAWDGALKNCSYRELKVNSGQQSASSLSSFLKNQEQLSQKISNFLAKKNSNKFLRNPVRSTLQKDKILNHDRQEYKRMKTVFGHANMTEGSALAVYNCKFDLSDKFIITGADDGIIKIWSKDTLILQASLHGHRDVIIDVQVSKCNRYMASGSKDGTVIFWDLHRCSIIKRVANKHSAQVNRIQFVMVPCTQKQAGKNLQNVHNNLPKHAQNLRTSEIKSYQRMISTVTYPTQANPTTQSQSQPGINQNYQQAQYDQFLLTCSDDGTIIIYDVSSLTKETRDEYYTKGADGHDHIYTPHSRALNKQREMVDPFAAMQSSLKNLKVTETHQKLNECEDEQNDKIQRRTRKRQLATGSGGNTNQTTANSSSQSQNQTQDGDLFMVQLRPEDFRSGSRNKHIDSFSVSQHGFLAGGTNHGEIYLWKVNFSNIRQRKTDGYANWINSFKVHKKANHYMQFSPDGTLLFSGSGDGTGALWDVTFIDKKARKHALRDPGMYSSQEMNLIDGTDNENHPQQLSLKNMEISEQQLVHRFEEKIDPNSSKKIECQIDGIEWSLTGRYAYCAISVKELNEEQENRSSQQQPRNQKPAIVKIQVYDTYSGQVIENLDEACKLGKEITNYACILKKHPLEENILLSCFDGGITVIYDVHKRQIVQEIVEYGIYSIDQFTMNNAVDVDFSTDGEYIAFTSIYGTLTLYTLQHHRQGQYLGTRIQQFFPYDNETHDHNPYERLQSPPQLCGFELNPYEVQPNWPTIGKFQRPPFKSKEEQDKAAEEFTRQQIFAREFANEEEKWYQDQLREGMRNGYFTTSAENNEENQQSNQIRLYSAAEIAPPSQQDDDLLPIDVDEMRMDSDADILNSDRQRHTGRRGNMRTRRLRNMEESPEDVDNTYDQEAEDEDEDFNEEDQSESDDEADSQKMNDIGELESEVGVGGQRIHGTRKETQYLNNGHTDRQNYHDMGPGYMEGNEDQSDQQMTNSQPRGRVMRSAHMQNNQRARSRGREGLRNLASQNDSLSFVNQHNSRRRLQQVQQSGETSQFGEGYDDASNYQESNIGIRTRQRGNARRNSNHQMELPSSDEESLQDYDSENEMDEEDSELIDRKKSQRRSRKRSHESNRQKRSGKKSRDRQMRSSKRKNYGDYNDTDMNEDDEDETSGIRLRQRNRDKIQSKNEQRSKSRTRSQQRINGSLRTLERGENGRGDHSELTQSLLNQANDDEIHPDDQDIERVISQIPTEAIEEHRRDDAYSQRGSKSKKGAVIIKEGQFRPLKEPYDEIYQLDNSNQQREANLIIQVCHFCKRAMDKHELIGPFVRDRGQAGNQILESQTQDDLDSQQNGLYFHRKCLEINNYVRYDKERSKWLNLDTAIQNLTIEKNYTCYRCLQPGSTVQCIYCDRSFHGHHCQKDYMLAQDYDDQEWYCIFCRNQQNHKNFKQNDREALHCMVKKKIGQIRKNIVKEHLFEKAPYQVDNIYVPQIGDEVMYFYQGHEKFHQSNNCFFYCGNQRNMSSTDLPWMRIPNFKNYPFGQLRCQVLNIYHKFASAKATYLLKEYGDCSSDITQKPQVISYIELEILDNLPQFSRKNKFIAAIFPSECLQFIIPIELYNHKLKLFQNYLQQNKLIGKKFSTHLKDKLFSGHDIKVVEVSPIEPDVLANSNWTSVVVVEVEPSQMLRSERHRRIYSVNDQNQNSDRSMTHRINFWDLIYPDAGPETPNLSEIAQKVLPKAFDDLENQRLVDVVTMFIQKRFDQCFEFLDRVPESIAEDYRCYIPAEMWLNLILDRLHSKYYRSQDQLWADLDLITHCSTTYNGEDEELTVKASAFVEKLRKELRQFVSFKKEKRYQKKQPSEDYDAPALGFTTDVPFEAANRKQAQQKDEIDQKNIISLSFDQEPPTDIGQKKPSTKLTRANKKFEPMQAANIGKGGASLKELLCNQNQQQRTSKIEFNQENNKITIDFNSNNRQSQQLNDFQSSQQLSTQMGNQDDIMHDPSSTDQIPQKKKRGRPRKHTRVIDEDASLQILGCTNSKQNTDNPTNEIQVSSRHQTSNQTGGMETNLDNQESQSTFVLDATNLNVVTAINKQINQNRQSQSNNLKDSNAIQDQNQEQIQIRVGQKRSFNHDGAQDDGYVQEEQESAEGDGQCTPENGSNVENTMSPNIICNQTDQNANQSSTRVSLNFPTVRKSTRNKRQRMNL